MRAVDVLRTDPDIEIRIIDVSEPVLGPHDLLVRVASVGLNWVDLRARAYSYGFEGQGRQARIPGIEMAGEVVAMGDSVKDFSAGDKVMGMTGSAAAELALLDHRIAMRVPAALDDISAGAFSVSGLTAHDALVTNGAFKTGQSVLVHAALSGVGIAATQIAQILDAKPVIGTASSAEKLELAHRFGVEVGIDYRKQPLVEAVMSATAKHGVDVVLDLIGGGVLTDNMNLCAIGGRIIGVGRFGGKTDMIDLDLLALRRLQLIGVTFRTRSIDEHALVVSRFVDHMGEAIAQGRLRVLLEPNNVLPFRAADEALRRIKARSAVGKVILTPQ